MDGPSARPSTRSSAVSRPDPLAAYRALLGAATALMVMASWPLWVGGGEFPRVPFVMAAPDIDGAPSCWLAIGMVAGILAGVAWRWAWPAAAACALALILDDQHRFQVWFYQWFVCGLVIALARGETAVGLIRAFHVAVYAHSGLSKLDLSFVEEIGREFLMIAARPLGMDPSVWPEWGRTAAILAIPVAELLIAAGLCFPRVRRWAIVVAIAMHAILVGLLGPWSLDHSANVLIWNVAFALETAIIFGRTGEAAASVREETFGDDVARAVVLLAILMPIFERAAWWDSWPSFALYASHCERTEVLLHEADAGHWPEEIRPHLRRLGDGPWHRLDLTAWSRAGRGTPPYPQGRAGVSVAEALARQCLVRVTVWGRAHPWTGRRVHETAEGFDAIRRLGDRFLLGGHPRPLRFVVQRNRPTDDQTVQGIER